ncbi:hypothetical protein [Frigoribacterium sp. PhB118]|uniref:hypothetical protein n=1 Tax=Frigoribacterium sp. PhB118 TaxID=2485175 RepID=UPI0011CE7271|nr:hypothetical protein [Frigoribacterium sp. PhB118]
MIFWPAALIGAVILVAGILILRFPKKIQEVLRGSGSTFMGNQGANALFGSLRPIRFAGILFILVGLVAISVAIVAPLTSS